MSPFCFLNVHDNLRHWHKTLCIEMTELLPLGARMTEETLIASARLHNHFSPDTAFPQINQHTDGFEELSAIIAKYNAHPHFRLRLLHRHTTIPEGQILLGAATAEPSGIWTTLTPICDVDMQKIHAHIISADVTNGASEDDRKASLLFPSEFRDGPPARLGNIDDNFFKEFTDCLRVKGLEKVFGLRVVQDRQPGKMIEFSFDIGSILINEEEVKAEIMEKIGQFKLEETEWTITVEDGTVCKTGETRCVTFPSGHIRVTDSKITCLSDAVKILRNDGMLV